VARVLVLTTGVSRQASTLSATLQNPYRPKDLIRNIGRDSRITRAASLGGSEVLTAVVGGSEVLTAVVEGSEVLTAVVEGSEVLTAVLGGSEVLTAVLGGSEGLTAVVGGSEVLTAVVGGSEVLTAVLMKSSIFWDVTPPCSPLNGSSLLPASCWFLAWLTPQP
jgi:hypothetical protein